MFSRACSSLPLRKNYTLPRRARVDVTRRRRRRHRCLYLVRESCGVPRPIVAVVVQTTTMTIGESNDDERGSSSFVGGDGSKNCGPV